MRRITERVAIAALLIGFGWAVGTAQTAQPDFELVVNSPTGETTVECQRGCKLAWVERGVNPVSRPMTTFTFSCNNAAQERCSSARIGGWTEQ